MTRATKVAKALKTKKIVKVAKVAAQTAKKAKVVKMAKVAVYTLLLFHFSLSATFALNMANVGTYTGSYTFIDDGNNSYKIKFLSSGSFIPKSNMIIDSFLVGGGGGGSSGGGGGGYTVTTKNILLEFNRSYTITVGAGGKAGQKYPCTNAGRGTATQAFGMTANGGYAGSTSCANRNGGNGGSGGGSESGAGGSNGGNGGAYSTYPGGTGQGTTTREFGESTGILYAGGGGGGCWGAAGAGGGGVGRRPGPADAGEANTGGGGGGVCDDNYYGGVGGTGVVVIRFQDPSTTAASVMSNIGTYSGIYGFFADSNNSYRIKFLTSGTFIPKSNMTIDGFLVGGGGGGSSGGGGGGYTVTTKNIPLTLNHSYTVTLGTGGSAGQKYPCTNASGGTATQAFNVTANGGYAGNTSCANRKGGNGGSGGGSESGAGGSNGGNGGAYSSYPGGTGQGTTTREFGESTGILYAGGGGGGCWGTGGAGGGGTGRRPGPGYSGEANTGGGGGGVCDDNYYGGVGGTGVVVIRLSDTTAPVCGTWSPATASWTNAASQVFTLTNSTDALSGIKTAGGSCSVTTNGGTCNVTISDKAGNTKVCTSPAAKIDRTAPVCGTWSPATASWTNAASQVFTLTNSTDALSGIKTAGGSCLVTANGGTCTIAISDNATNTTTCTSPVAKIEHTTPTGGSISYATSNFTKADQTLNLVVNDGSDADAGIDVASRQLMRREATMDSQGACSATYSNYYPVTFSGTYPNITTSNFEIAKCYQYQWTVADNVGNQAQYTSNTIVTTIPETLSFQSLPVGTIIAANNVLFTKANVAGLLLGLNSYPYFNTFSQNFAYTGAVQSYTVPETGWYQIELWGAQGAGSVSRGAYTSGKIYLQQNETLYFYLGEGNHSTANSISFNGGTSNSGGYNGGGATDVRLTNDAWNNAASLASRIMVAAGSGSGSGNKTPFLGAGGTLVGDNGGGTSSGSQIEFGAAQSTSYTASAFGIANGGCSGGNGYYPGGGATCASGAGGGSSFISGYAGVNAITSASSTAATGRTKHYLNKYFLAGAMQPNANSGHGKAKITHISEPQRVNPKLNGVRYIKDCATQSYPESRVYWSELQAIKDGTNLAKGITPTGSVTAYSTYVYTKVTDGDSRSNSTNYGTTSTSDNTSRCLTIDLGQAYDLDEIAVWHLVNPYYPQYIHYNNFLAVSSDDSNWTTVLDSVTGTEGAEGRRVDAYSYTFEQTGSVQTFVAPQSGTYFIEAYGAQGGFAKYTTMYKGGLGGYSAGNIYLNKNDTLYIYVGGLGQSATGTNAPALSANGNGYNGGAPASSYVNNSTHGGGGGASDVRLIGGNWNDTTSLRSRILVAGGGGGASSHSSTPSYSGDGGEGGGLVGSASFQGNTTCYAYGAGGSQTAGGASITCDTDGHAYDGVGTFGAGYGYSSYSNTGTIAGGGGGYYGGGAGRHAGGGGGSGFISGYPGCNAVNADGVHTGSPDHYSGKIFTNGVMRTGVRIGNGLVKISFVSPN